MSKKEEKPKQGEDSKITKTAEEQDKDFKASGIEGTKDTEAEDTKPEEEEKKEKPYVTCEDIIKTLRAKGHKI